jgi:hypothetical protein
MAFTSQHDVGHVETLLGDPHDDAQRLTVDRRARDQKIGTARLGGAGMLDRVLNVSAVNTSATHRNDGLAADMDGPGCARQPLDARKGIVHDHKMTSC